MLNICRIVLYYYTKMKKIIFVLLLLAFPLLLLCLLPSRAWAWEEHAVHDGIADVFKDIEAVFSWHVEDRKTLKEVAEETWQGILA